MARNKYPEKTVEKILMVSQKLFFTKGYDETSIQDIINELDGLTKGAIYHHFKSKEEILEALNEKMFFDNNPFAAVKNRDDLNGLEKMRESIKISTSNIAPESLVKESIALLKNPRILVSSIESSRKWIVPLLQELIEEGNKDGSINTPYSKEIAEVIQLLTNVWMSPSVFPATGKEIFMKFLFLKEMLDNMGLPLIDNEILAMTKKKIGNTIK